MVPRRQGWRKRDGRDGRDCLGPQHVENASAFGGLEAPLPDPGTCSRPRLSCNWRNAPALTSRRRAYYTTKKRRTRRCLAPWYMRNSLHFQALVSLATLTQRSRRKPQDRHGRRRTDPRRSPIQCLNRSPYPKSHGPCQSLNAVWAPFISTKVSPLPRQSSSDCVWGCRPSGSIRPRPTSRARSPT